MHRPVDRRAGRGEDRGDAERLVLVQGDADPPGAVRDDDRVPDVVVERARDLAAEHGVEQVAERGGAGDGLEPPLVAVAVVLEVGLVRAEHAKAPGGSRRARAAPPSAPRAGR